MSKALRMAAWIGVGFVIVVGGTLTMNQMKSRRILEKTRTVAVRPVSIPTDAAALARGKHIAQSRGCVDCHGADLGGAKVVESGAMGVWYGPNLTSGKGGRAGTFSNDDWVRAIRHGVGPDGRGLFLMPSEEYQHLGDDDLGAVIAYLKSVPPVDRPNVPIQLGLIAQMLVATNKIKLSADVIDHLNVRPPTVAPGVTLDYGRYVAVGCVGCHGPNYSGGKIEIGPPEWPEAANLTPHASSRLTQWSEEDFIRTLRSGRRPDGTELNVAMPRNFGLMNDVELKALWMYLKSLPAVETGKR